MPRDRVDLVTPFRAVLGGAAGAVVAILLLIIALAVVSWWLDGSLDSLERRGIDPEALGTGILVLGLWAGVIGLPLSVVIGAWFATRRGRTRARSPEIAPQPTPGIIEDAGHGQERLVQPPRITDLAVGAVVFLAVYAVAGAIIDSGLRGIGRQPPDSPPGLLLIYGVRLLLGASAARAAIRGERAARATSAAADS